MNTLGTESMAAMDRISLEHLSTTHALVQLGTAEIVEWKDEAANPLRRGSQTCVCPSRGAAHFERLLA